MSRTVSFVLEQVNKRSHIKHSLTGRITKTLFLFPILTILFVTTFVTAESLGCPLNMFQINEGGRCKPDACVGECIDIFTCCADMCFSMNMTEGLVESCNIQEDKTVKTCSKHLEEMNCIASLTNSTPTVCHEQIKWMTREGLFTFAPADLENCPCERNYTLLDSYCNFEICRNTTDCVNTTDILYNTDVCCYSNNLNPTDDICEKGDEVVTVIQSPDIEKCNETCYDQGATCRTSNSTFSGCCRRKLLSPASSENINTIETATDGFVIALIVAFVVIALAGCFTFGICIYRRKFKRPVDDKTLVLGIGSIEEDIKEQDDVWTNVSETYNISQSIQEEERDDYHLQNHAEVGEFETTVDINQDRFYRELDTPPMEDHRISSDESDEEGNDGSHFNKDLCRSIVNHDNDNAGEEPEECDQKQNDVVNMNGVQRSKTDPNLPTVSSSTEIISHKRKMSLAIHTENVDQHSLFIGDVDENSLGASYLKMSNEKIPKTEIVITQPINKKLQENRFRKHKRNSKDALILRRHSVDENAKSQSTETQHIDQHTSKTQEPSFSLRKSATAPNIHRIHKVKNVSQHKDSCNSEFNVSDIELETYNPIDIIDEESDDSGVLNSSFSSSSGINIGANSSQARNLRSATPLTAAIGGAIGGQQTVDFTHID